MICALFTPILVISVFKYRAQCEVQARGVNSNEKWKLLYIYTGDQKVKERYTSQNYGGFRGIVDSDTDNKNVEKRKRKHARNFETVSI